MVRLKAGDRFRNHPDTGDSRTYEVMSVNAGSLSIRCADRTRTEFETAEGEDVGFDKPGRRFTVCLRPLGIELVEA